MLHGTAAIVGLTDVAGRGFQILVNDPDTFAEALELVALEGFRARDLGPQPLGIRAHADSSHGRRAANSVHCLRGVSIEELGLAVLDKLARPSPLPRDSLRVLFCAGDVDVLKADLDP